MILYISITLRTLSSRLEKRKMLMWLGCSLKTSNPRRPTTTHDSSSAMDLIMSTCSLYISEEVIPIRSTLGVLTIAGEFL